VVSTQSTTRYRDSFFFFFFFLGSGSETFSEALLKSYIYS
jgi:hypothetical protein